MWVFRKPSNATCHVQSVLFFITRRKAFITQRAFFSMWGTFLSEMTCIFSLDNVLYYDDMQISYDIYFSLHCLIFSLSVPLRYTLFFQWLAMCFICFISNVLHIFYFPCWAAFSFSLCVFSVFHYVWCSIWRMNFRLCINIIIANFIISIFKIPGISESIRLHIYVPEMWKLHQ